MTTAAADAAVVTLAGRQVRILPPCSARTCVVPAAVVHRGVLLCAPCWLLLPPGAR